MSDNSSPRTLYKREKTARVSFAENEAIQTVINYYVDDLPVSTVSSASSSSSQRLKRQDLLNQSLDSRLLNNVKIETKTIEQVNYDRIRLEEEKRRKKEIQDAQINEIESKARIKSAQSKKRKQSIENEKHKIEEDMMRRRFLHERDKLYEFDSVKPKSNNEITKLPDVSLNSSKIKQQNQLNDSTNNRSIYLPSLKTLSREQSSHTIPTTPNNNLSPRIIIERDRIKAEEGAKLKNVIENLDSNKSKKENKNGGGGTGGSNRSKHNKKTKTKEELEMEKEAEENAKKVAEIKALKQRLIENKKQTEYKIDHLKDRKEIKIRRTEEEEEKIREIEEQKRKSDEKQRRKEDKKAKKAAELRALKLAEELAKKRADEERRQLEFEQAQRAARLNQEKMLLLSHRFLLNDFKNVK